jgi:5'-methylthioadenosine phosphorylase
MENHVKRVGIIAGTVLQGIDAFEGLEERIMTNEFGEAPVLSSDTIVYVPRHGIDPKRYILPHLINHQANLKAFKDSGVQDIIGINSTGSLKKDLRPGTIVIPDDFIMLSGAPTIFENDPVHITPFLSKEIRNKLLKAADECGTAVVNGGVYWQTPGPRLETRAEIRMMSHFADLIGMTLGSEAVTAGELGLHYAAICSVDNYGHGLVEKSLTMEEIVEGAHRNADVMIKIIGKYLERS